jgi:hypothetical protein
MMGVGPKTNWQEQKSEQMGWTSRKPSQNIVVGLAKPSSLFDENLQMVYLIHQLSFDESMVKYTQKVMN